MLALHRQICKLIITVSYYPKIILIENWKEIDYSWLLTQTTSIVRILSFD